MKVKIQAGAELDVMSAPEARQVIAEARASWVAEIAKGTTFRRFGAIGMVRGDGSLVIGGPEDPHNDLGPDSGFLWDVRRIRISGFGSPDEIGVYINERADSQIVATTHDVAGAFFRFDTQVILQPGEQLVIANVGELTNTPAGQYVSVSGQVREMPTALAWRLGGSQ